MVIGAPLLDFAVIFYQGFDNPEDVYQAFREKELLAALKDNKTYKWDARLPEGYCIMHYMPYSYKTHDENGSEVRQYSATVLVNNYESYELYEKIQARMKALQEAKAN